MDRRQESRHSADESVRVKAFDASHAVTAGRILDISDKGMQLSLTAGFPLGSKIELESADWILRGAVIYCSQQKTSGRDVYYSIGIRIEPVPW